MPVNIKIGPFLSKPIWSEGNYVRRAVSGVTVDIYLPTDTPADIPVGSGLYTGITQTDGYAYFILPDIS